ncbi:hypothetical protein F5Y08DRAFT_300895, partial [Xylaria arbuscula]
MTFPRGQDKTRQDMTTPLFPQQARRQTDEQGDLALMRLQRRPHRMQLHCTSQAPKALGKVKSAKNASYLNLPLLYLSIYYTVCPCVCMYVCKYVRTYVCVSIFLWCLCYVKCS